MMRASSSVQEHYADPDKRRARDKMLSTAFFIMEI
jgi:hypothetical protein